MRSAAIDSVLATLSRKCRQRIPGVLRNRDPRYGRTEGLLRLDFGTACRVQCGFKSQPPIPRRLLVGHVRLQRKARLDQVVGKQTGSCVTHLRLDHRRLAGHLSLPAQWLELAADLRDQVREPVEVALAGFQLPERLLLALAVLEDAGRLLDEATPTSGVACRIESSCPWPTITCISRPMPESLSRSWISSRRTGWELMAYSEPPLRNIVREMVTSAYSNRQSTIGVVDGEHHLGATERGRDQTSRRK